MPSLFHKFNWPQSFKIIIIEAFFHINIDMGFFPQNVSVVKRGNSLIDRHHSLKIKLI
jgi:hypothetical protein